ncbi:MULTISPECIES: ParB/RepB/Spo0J family partition protein [Alphaproteobacteria]|jgi:ParB family chromosome partitioning protein|uniref:ParB/RepB/Spo0J family partition protein n=1 Tax=Alphaproteobacteria TaxID=28211 RepID=UPI00114E7569|nr:MULTISPECIES: ParB/RepB/Spo0J family partition protein [Alphaproteobacteria]MBF5088467.1 ParB/RepB/Spo0J family partition protein [Novosphingobium sp. NBM11]MBX9875124.1 ParB/RepB/Spo0J family partition protein [Beijerinckiaceae bacterium]NTE96345.1 ParB/RepB/Spo0J family partition protein [Agrobacterium tumefaciens]TQN60932.1 ParB/RepB/Spo0J family partition protein [Agrobacterium tumefaciens]
MATAVQKIASLGERRDIPFNKLILSQANVRKTKAGVSIPELAEDIGHRGLLQNLNVRPVLDGEGVETGIFEVPAGGRRFRALELLVKAKRLAKTAPVPCNVRDAGSAIPAEEDSLAENVHREALHPLDQFKAFQALMERGMGEEDIAARFYVTPAVVRQRLRLASVAPALLDVYAEDGIALDQLMAFTVSHDHARQMEVWETIQRSYSRQPYEIRRMLTEGAVRASDRRAQFVGIEAYEAAGGATLRDLFLADDGGWLQDPALLDTLATSKLGAAAEEIAAEGWRWIDAALDFPYGHTTGLRRIAGERPELSADEQAAYEALTEELDRLYAEHDDGEDLPEAVDLRLEEIETGIAAFQNRPTLYDPAEIVRAGAFVSIDSSGRLTVERGYVRPEDEAPIEPRTDGDGEAEGTTTTSEPMRAVITIGGKPEPEDDEDDVVKPLPERLVSELTAHRTLALRDALARNPHVAITALLHKLVLDTFHRTSSSGGCLEVSVRHVFFSVQAADLKDSTSAKSVAERQEGWEADIPQDEDALWNWLVDLDDASRTALLAHCVSYGVNALSEKVDRYGGSGISQHGLERRLKQADRIARAVGLDMAEAGWRPTVDNYLSRVTKPRILEAVREAKGDASAQLIDHLKKGDMAKEAERLLVDTGWLPEPLRLADLAADPASDAQSGGEAEVAELPDFLSTDEDPETPANGEDDERHLVAAE